MTTVPPPTRTHAERTERHQAVLDELIALASDMARAIHQDATRDPATTPDATVAFDRVARTIRRAILLSRKIAEPLPTRAIATPQADPTQGRERVLRAVENRIHNTARPTDAPALHAELLDRLDTEHFTRDLATLPTSEIIETIVEDLGLAENDLMTYPRRTLEDIETLGARAHGHRIEKPWIPQRPRIIGTPRSRTENLVAALTRKP